MKKRLLILILAAVFTGISFASCSLNNDYISDYEDEEETEEEDEEESGKEQKSNIPDAETQIALIAKNAKVWFGNEISDMYSYCVTDLDSNGRLEVIASGIGGTGFFSYGNIYEINETFDGVVPCGEEGELEIDISNSDFLEYYIDKESGKAFYSVFDHTRMGWAEHIVVKYVLSLENCCYEVNPVATCNIITDDVEYEETYYYYDAEDNEVDKDYYDNCYDIVFEGYKKKTASLYWQTAEKIPYEDITDDSGLYLCPEYDELVTLLTESYEGFSME